MKKNLILASVLILLFGCGGITKEVNTLARINDYEITQEEFEQEFKESTFGQVDTLESRKEFLNNLINRKLILQDAQRKGLDKDKSFLRMIQKFWEQSLIKLTIDRKSKEVAGSSFVSDKKIEEVYNQMLQEGKTDKPYDQIYGQIKWEVTKLKEAQMINNWIDGLRKSADIKINYDLLQQNK